MGCLPEDERDHCSNITNLIQKLQLYKLIIELTEQSQSICLSVCQSLTPSLSVSPLICQPLRPSVRQSVSQSVSWSVYQTALHYFPTLSDGESFYQLLLHVLVINQHKPLRSAVLEYIHVTFLGNNNVVAFGCYNKIKNKQTGWLLTCPLSVNNPTTYRFIHLALITFTEHCLLFLLYITD